MTDSTERRILRGCIAAVVVAAVAGVIVLLAHPAFGRRHVQCSGGASSISFVHGRLSGPYTTTTPAGCK